MQVICNREKGCKVKGCDGHHPHFRHETNSCKREGGIPGAICVPVQSDFERGQEEMKKLHIKTRGHRAEWYTFLNGFPRLYAFDWRYYRELPSDSNPDEMPKGVCRNCGHGMFYHYTVSDCVERGIENRQEVRCGHHGCSCTGFVFAEPLTPTKKDEARQEGRKEVVEWVEEMSEYNDGGEGGWYWISEQLLQAKKEEWGL